jgi:hypothetical protein
MNRILAGLAAAALLMVASSAYAQVPNTLLTWTSPGDDGDVGTATSYDMRWSAAVPDTASLAAMDSWWNSATIVTAMPSPLVAGTTQSKLVAPIGGFATGLTYHFVIRAADEVPNWSGYSNVAVFTPVDVTPPSKVTNLVAH